MTDKKQFVTVHADSRKSFDEQVNHLLENGYELYGQPIFQTVSMQDSWGDRQRAWKESTYTQSLKLKNP